VTSWWHCARQAGADGKRQALNNKPVPQGKNVGGWQRAQPPAFRRATYSASAAWAGAGPRYGTAKAEGVRGADSRTITRYCLYAPIGGAM